MHFLFVGLEFTHGHGYGYDGHNTEMPRRPFDIGAGNERSVTHGDYPYTK